MRVSEQTTRVAEIAAVPTWGGRGGEDPDELLAVSTAHGPRWIHVRLHESTCSNRGTASISNFSQLS